MSIGSLKLATSVILLLSLTRCRAQNKPEKLDYQKNPASETKKIALNVDNPQQQNVLQYPSAFASFIPELQSEKSGPFSEKQTFPRIHPQLLFYPGSFAPGQQFLLQPASPPNNFLIPQPQPGVEIILRDTPQFLTPAGYPKPAHVPPIEKDAEEIPTDQVGVHHPFPKNKGKKPEKLETLDTETEKVATEAEVLAEADKNGPNKPTTSSLKPGQRFFFLNGQTLFPSFSQGGLNSNPNQFFDPFHFFEQFPRQNTESLEKQADIGNQKGTPTFNQDSLQGLQRNPVTGQITNVKDTDQKPLLFSPENSVLLNQQLRADNPFLPFYTSFTSPILEGTSNDKNKEVPQGQEKLSKQTVSSLTSDQFSSIPSGYSLLESDVGHIFGNGIFPGLYDFGNLQHGTLGTNEGIAVNANYQQSQNNGAAPANVAQNGNPTVSQAQPAAVAVAGKGGSASASPKATSLAGKRGTAIASPLAAAFAGTEGTKAKVPQTKS